MRTSTLTSSCLCNVIEHWGAKRTRAKPVTIFHPVDLEDNRGP